MTNKIDQTPHISTIIEDVWFSLYYDPGRAFADVAELLEHLAHDEVMNDNRAPEAPYKLIDVLDRCGLATVLCIDATAVEGWLLEQAHLELDEDANAHHNIYDDSVDAIAAFIKALNSKRRYYRSAGRRCHVTVQDVRDMWTTLKEEDET